MGLDGSMIICKCLHIFSAVVVLLHLTDMFPPSYTDDQKGVIVTYATALVYLNIVANPLIYAFKIRRRKQSMRRCAMIQSITPEALPRRVTSLDPGHKDAFELSEVLKATLNQ